LFLLAYYIIRMQHSTIHVKKLCSSNRPMFHCRFKKVSNMLRMLGCIPFTALLRR